MSTYRNLEEGEVILPTDEWSDGQGNWHKRADVKPDTKLHLYENGGSNAPHRRKVDYPEHTPPAAPEGMKWEYRGMGTVEDRSLDNKYFVRPDGTTSEVGSSNLYKKSQLHYFEAVPDFPNLVITEGAHGWNFGKSINPLDPKGAAGALKPQLQLIPTVAMREEAKALDDGRNKYGQDNWRTNKVCASTYIGAILRHTLAYRDGEDVDPESKSGVNHLGSVRACCAILLDAAANGMLVDDRPTNHDTTI